MEVALCTCYSELSYSRRIVYVLVIHVCGVLKDPQLRELRTKLEKAERDAREREEQNKRTERLLHITQRERDGVKAILQSYYDVCLSFYPHVGKCVRVRVSMRVIGLCYMDACTTQRMHAHSRVSCRKSCCKGRARKTRNSTASKSSRLRLWNAPP